MIIKPSKDLKDKVVELAIIMNKINRNKIVDADITCAASPVNAHVKAIKLTLMEEGAGGEITEHVFLMTSHRYKK